MNIASLLGAVPDPDRPALIFPGRPNTIISFGRLDERAARLAGGFHRLGLRADDRVILLAPVSPNLFATLIALFRLGATAVFLDLQAGWRQLDQAAGLASASAFIGTDRAMWLRPFLPALRRIPIVIRAEGRGSNSLHRLFEGQPPRPEIHEVEPETAALITFTGGSTDSAGPRGVMRTHRLLAAQHAAIARVLPAISDDIDMPAFPIVTLHNLAAGITSVIPDYPFRRPQAVRPESVLRQISQHRVTTASGSPAYWQPIADHCLAHHTTLPLRRIVIGGAPVTAALVERLSRSAPRAEIVGVYGSTEAEPVALMPAAEILSETAARTASGAGIPLGHPVSDICVRILNPRREQQPAGVSGEIWVAGEHVARAYFSNPGATAANKFQDDDGQLWHCMGDLGYRDQAGRLWLTGRMNTVIERDGEPLYPVPVEAMIESLPYIQRAALIGMGGTLSAEAAVLIVELRPGTAAPPRWRSALGALCAQRGWHLDGVYAVPRLPVDRRHNARIDYARLKAFARTL